MLGLALSMSAIKMLFCQLLQKSILLCIVKQLLHDGKPLPHILFNFADK